MKILLVEDDINLSETIVDYLEIKGLAVRHVQTVKDAVAAISEIIPDIIISDVMLPDGTGYQLLEFIKDNLQLDFTQFVFLSALSDKKHTRKGMNLGADDYLHKPFDFEDLIEAIQRAERKLSEKKNTFGKLSERLSDQEHKIEQLIDINSHELRGRVLKINNIIRLMRDGVIDGETGLSWLLSSSEFLDSTFLRINHLLSDYEVRFAPGDTSKTQQVDQLWIIDDDQLQLQIMEMMIKHQKTKIQLRTFSNARSALEALRSGETPDVIFLDIRMPEMDGFGFLSEMNSAGFADPVIMLTSSVSTSDIERSFSYANVIGYESKPINVTSLKRILQQ